MRVSTVVTVLPLALAKPLGDMKRAELAPVILHANVARSDMAALILHEDESVKLATRSSPAPLYLHEDEKSIHARGGSDRYIIKFKPDTDDAEIEKALKDITDEKLTHRYKNKFQGFTADMDGETVEKFRMNPIVQYIEQDVAGQGSANLATQNECPWGLRRISHHQAGGSGYVFNKTGGEGVCVYITDTGIDENHPQFQGRAHQIKSFIPGVNYDDHGHGTHCAGTIGSLSFGVAKKATMYGVKVIDRDNSFRTSDLIAAYDFILQDAPRRDCPKGVVVSGSLGGPFSPALNQAAGNMANNGIFMAVAAGNDNRDARYFSPASAPNICTVGGVGKGDLRYDMSNHGPIIDINAPAVAVISAKPGGGMTHMTGTSMAAPHIAGLAAYIGSQDANKVSPDLCQTMARMATQNAIRNQVYGTTSNIAHNGNEFA
ncbi:Cuticle-degrading protease [Beauveria bassiana]|nr:Cuticle-degrading protease [Beauveria bassiana]KAH8720121.1 Cuticle-degrading protease [Beauveria bassiana]